MKIKMLFGALVALATLAGCNAQQPASASLDDLFLTRRSIRNYEPGRTISEAHGMPTRRCSERSTTPCWR